MKNEPLVFERTYNAPVTKVWQALTDKEKMKQWYFDVPEFKPQVGTEFSFTAGKDCDNQFLHLCRVTEAIENKKIAYTWRYDGYPGDSQVSFELFDEDGKTRLVLTHEGLENFGDNPAFAKDNFRQGWTYFTETALENFLAK